MADEARARFATLAAGPPDNQGAAMREPTTRPLLVVAGVLFRDGRVLAGQRRATTLRHPLKWEFPGGKMEIGEDARTALVRELREELCVEATVTDVLHRNTHTYPDGACVEIAFLQVSAIDRPPANRAFAEIRWVRIRELEHLDFLGADHPFVTALRTGAVVPSVTAMR